MENISTSGFQLSWNFSSVCKKFVEDNYLVQVKNQNEIIKYDDFTFINYTVFKNDDKKFVYLLNAEKRTEISIAVLCPVSSV